MSPDGKQRSSLNSAVHGLSSTGLLLPHEDPEGYRRHVDAWISSIQPVDEAELQAALAVADLRWRQRRLDQIELNRLRGEIEDRVAQSQEDKSAEMLRSLTVATGAMAAALAVPPVSCEEGQLWGLIAASRRVAEMIQLAEISLGVDLGGAKVSEQAGLLGVLSVDKLDHELLAELMHAALTSQAAIEEQMQSALEAVTLVRQRLEQQAPLPDDRDSRLRQRYRRDLERRLASEMNLLGALRERRKALGSSGSLGRVQDVQIRLIK